MESPERPPTPLVSHPVPFAARLGESSVTSRTDAPACTFAGYPVTEDPPTLGDRGHHPRVSVAVLINDATSSTLNPITREVDDSGILPFPGFPAAKSCGPLNPRASREAVELVKHW